MAWKTLVAAVAGVSLLSQGIPVAGASAARFPIKNESQPQVVDRSTRPAGPAVRKLQRPSDPETVALLIHLLDRYASEVPDKSELDRRVEQRLSQNGITRESARRMMANFRKISLADRRAVLGEWADIPTRQRIPESRYRAAFERAAQTAGPVGHPVSTDSHPANPSARRSPKQLKPARQLQPHGWLNSADTPQVMLTSFRQSPESRDSEMPRIQHISYSAALAFQQAAYPRYLLWYEGLWCHEETSIDGTGDSDQIYIITTVTDEAGNVTTRLHPRPYGTDTYDLVNAGDHRTGPRSRVSGNGLGRRGRPISGLPAQDLILTVAVFEHDEGDPEETASVMGAALAIGAASCFFIPLPACLVGTAGALLLGAVAALLSGGGDDLISTETVSISSSQITQWAAQEPRLKEGEIPYHFSTIHNGGAFDITNPFDGPAGADYHVYFTVREVPPPPAR